MAQLKDSLLMGDLRVTDNIYTSKLIATMQRPTTGTGVAAVTSSPYKPAIWTFNCVEPGTLQTGDMFFIIVPVAGHSNGVFISVDNGVNYYPVSVNGTTRLSTHFQVNNTICIAFDSTGNTANVYPLAGGTATETISGGCWRTVNFYDANTTPTPYTSTAAGTQTKGCTCTDYALGAGQYFPVTVKNANTYNGLIKFNINSKGAKNVWINGAVSSSSNKTLPAGTWIAYYDGTNYYVNTDGDIPAPKQSSSLGGFMYNTNNIIYSSTTPATRTDGSALKAGDIWLQPAST